MNRELLYWIIAGGFLVYYLIKYKRDYFFLLTILFFFEGLFTFFGQITWDLYKISLPIFAIFILVIRRGVIRISRRDQFVVSAFLLLSFSFFLSSYLNNDYLLLILNQYSKYLLPFLSYFLVKAHANQFGNLDRMVNLIKDLLNLQIVLTIVKFFLLGIYEDVVGSISSQGGSAAAVLPILGFIFIWMNKSGRLKRKDWIYILMLLFIGVVSMKRAIWIIFPIFAVLLFYYVPRRALSIRYLYLLPLILLLFYIGVRLNPSLNKERDVWGSFDFSHTYEYIESYTFGEEKESSIHVGRGSATLWTLESIFSPNIRKSFTGNGLLHMYASNPGKPENPSSAIKISGLNSITMATGLFQNYYTGGLLGVFSFLTYILVLCLGVRYSRIRHVLFLCFAWEYFMYANSLMRTPALSFFFIFLIIYANFVKYPQYIARKASVHLS